ncbi:MAG: DUF4330 family protein [Clostridia bacterium]|nr:DUF4330 family protein [Clostridia bacterium]
MAKIKEKRKKFNFIDAILLMVILVLVAAFSYIGFKAYDNYFQKQASGIPIKYQILVEGVSNDIKYSVNKGDAVIETATLTSIGKVLEYSITPSKFMGVDENGNVVVNDHPSESDILITVEVNATGIGGTYDINGYSITAGKDLNFRIPGLRMQGKCIAVEESDE